MIMPILQTTIQQRCVQSKLDAINKQYRLMMLVYDLSNYLCVYFCVQSDLSFVDASCRIKRSISVPYRSFFQSQVIPVDFIITRRRLYASSSQSSLAHEPRLMLRRTSTSFINSQSTRLKHSILVSSVQEINEKDRPNRLHLSCNNRSIINTLLK